MLIPSIDLQGGQTVQLVGGKTKALEAGDPRPIARRFRLAGEIAVIDLDAAMGTGSNEVLIHSLLDLAPCRVGGGIRDVETALRWLDRGAAKVILGTKAIPEILRELPRERVIAAVDAVDGEVVVEGWRTKTGERLLDRIAALREYADGFLITFVEREGRMAGTNLDQVRTLVEAATPARVTFAGGVTTAEDIAAIDRFAADAQVGMALYTKRLGFAEAIAAPVMSLEQPWPAVICDRRGRALGFTRVTLQTLESACEHLRFGGDELLRVELDQTRSAFRITVDSSSADTAWGPSAGFAALEATLAARRQHAPPGSYAARLFGDAALLRAKLIEEAGELADATTPEHVAEEAADVGFFASLALARAGLSWSDVAAVLDRRALKVTRRPGEAKK